jgi:LPXTG-motif cell wall-anchored protein
VVTARPGQGQGPGQGQQPNRLGELPRTGADQLVPLTITGVALVGIGAGIVVASRRRRETSMPSGLA